LKELSELKNHGNKKQHHPGDEEVEQVAYVKEEVGIPADHVSADSSEVVIPEIKPDPFPAELIVQSRQGRKDHDDCQRNAGIPPYIGHFTDLSRENKISGNGTRRHNDTHGSFGKHGHANPGKTQENMTVSAGSEKTVQLPKRKSDKSL
jgi:hypothetical protein